MRYPLIILFLLLSITGTAEPAVIRIYQDADLSNNAASSEAIQKGIELAFDEIDNEIDGHQIEFKYLDHRGNVVRSQRNYQHFIDDTNALAIYSGIHSPPLIKNREFINQQKALTLVPWAAGGPITRYPSSENWIFRLSVDDTQAGKFIVEHALQKQGCEKPHLLLEDTPWGSSNLYSMSAALRDRNINEMSATRFSWNIKKNGARIILRDITGNGYDCIILVANSAEGASIISEMVKLPVQSRIPIISHWGITGGSFTDVVSAYMRQSLELHFIQTCFAFTNEQQNDFARQVFSRLVQYTDGAIETPSMLKSAVGFIHAYDLTKILIQAIRQTGLTGDTIHDRNAIRLALEDIREPVQGLVKTYISPFSVFDTENGQNGHEALNADDYCMGEFGPDNEVLIFQD